MLKLMAVAMATQEFFDVSDDPRNARDHTGDCEGFPWQTMQKQPLDDSAHDQDANINQGKLNGCTMYRRALLAPPSAALLGVGSFIVQTNGSGQYGENTRTPRPSMSARFRQNHHQGRNSNGSESGRKPGASQKSQTVPGFNA